MCERLHFITYSIVIKTFEDAITYNNKLWAMDAGDRPGIVTVSHRISALYTH